MEKLLLASVFLVFLSSCKKAQAPPMVQVCEINTISETTIHVNGNYFQFDSHHIFDYNGLISINFLNNHLIKGAEVQESFLFINIQPKIGKYFLTKDPLDRVTPSVEYSVTDIDVPTDSSYPDLLKDNWIEITKICDDGIVGKASLKLVDFDPSSSYGFYGSTDTLNVHFEFAISR